MVQKAKESGTPALYFTNLISARPLMGPAGAGSLAEVVNGAIGSKPRFDRMKAFFEGVGTGDKTGVWPTAPEKRAVPKRRTDVPVSAVGSAKASKYGKVLDSVAASEADDEGDA